MIRPPFPIGTIHFIGIGGIGMSGIAEILHNLGYRVQGSDMAENANVERLRAMGVTIHSGHDAGHVRDASVVVVSSAIKNHNPELEAARGLRLPVVRRADMLAEIMRLRWGIAVAGTHGKTTTTSIIAALFDAADHDPTVINGGIINAYGTNAHLGRGEWLIAEADESDGSFLRLPSTIGVVTNIDPEHLDHYGSFDAVRQAFHDFVEKLPFYGFAVLCIDHPEVQTLLGKITDRRVITYGFSPQADIRAHEPRFDNGHAVFDVELRARDGGEPTVYKDLRLAMPGRHNVQNALSAVAIGRELGFTEATMRRAFEGFRGVKRRFTVTGRVEGVTVIDDYGHHPVEIRAVLRTAREAFSGKVVAVVQPHRYSRLHDLFDDFCTAFNDADSVLVAPVYAAGESPIEGADRDHLVEGLIRHGHRDVRPLDGADSLAGDVIAWVGEGDAIVCLGAGNITAWAAALPEQLARLKAGRGGA